MLYMNAQTDCIGLLVKFFFWVAGASFASYYLPNMKCLNHLQRLNSCLVCTVCLPSKRETHLQEVIGLQAQVPIDLLSPRLRGSSLCFYYIHLFLHKQVGSTRVGLISIDLLSSRLCITSGPSDMWVSLACEGKMYTACESHLLVRERCIQRKHKIIFTHLCITSGQSDIFAVPYKLCKRVGILEEKL